MASIRHGRDTKNLGIVQTASATSQQYHLRVSGWAGAGCKPSTGTSRKRRTTIYLCTIEEPAAKPCGCPLAGQPGRLQVVLLPRCSELLGGSRIASIRSALNSSQCAGGCAMICESSSFPSAPLVSEMKSGSFFNEINTASTRASIISSERTA